MKKAIMAALAVFSYLASFGQVTQPFNNPVGGNYVGFDNTSGIALPIENRGHREIDLSSNGFSKIAVDELATWNGLNGLTRDSVQRTTMGLRGQSQLAWSMLHLLDSTAGNLDLTMRRSWMNVGTSYTANIDFMYTGLLERPTPGQGGLRTDAVIAWGCQNTFNSADNFRLIFLQPGFDPDDQGLETMRMTPWGYMGVGDGFSNTQQPWRRTVIYEDGDSAQFRIAHTLNATSADLGDHADFQVTDRGVLHLKSRETGIRRPIVAGFLNEDINGGNFTEPSSFTWLDIGGVTRVRNLPDSVPNCLITGYQADTLGGIPEADNYLTRLDFPQDSTLFLAGNATWRPTSLEDCRWKDNPDVFTPYEVMYMGLDDQSDCYRTKLAIGTNQVKSKLGVENLVSRDRVSVGLIVSSENNDSAWEAADNSGRIVGLISTAEGPYEAGLNHFGMEAFAEKGKIAIGVVSSADGGANHSIGVYSTADNALSTPGVPPATPNIAYYGEVFNTGDVAAYMIGPSINTVFPIGISDESVKTEVEDISNASEQLSQLSPKSYYHVSPDNRSIAFDDDIQYGLIAQEVQAIFPELVEETTIPEIRDSTGNFVEGTSVNLLGVQYEAFIPILIAAFQEQNASLTAQIQENEILQDEVANLTQQLQEQEATIASMQEQMNDVLSAVQQMQSNVTNCCGTAPVEKGHSETGNLELEQNFPNPFETETTINFSIAEPAQIRLEISDAQGRVLEVLVNGNLDAGSYTRRWDASGYAPGTYYYSLYADTELLTKKMIKR